MIELLNVKKNYGNQKVLNIKEMKFENDKTYMVYGPSGMGKSTLLNVIAGVRSIDSGKIMVDGEEISKLSQLKKDEYRLKKVGYIFQNFKLLENMSVRENLELLNIELKNLNDYMPLLIEVGLEDKIDKKVSTLSGGEKQRLAICRAIYKKPSIILADEPTGNLNGTIAKKIMELLIKLSKENQIPLIVVSHDLSMLKLFDCTVEVSSLLGGVKNV